MRGINPKALHLSVFLLVFFVIWTLRATLFYQIDMAMAGATDRTVYSTVLKCVLWIVPALLFVYYVRKASPIHYLGLSTFPRMHDCIYCALVIGGFLSVVTVLETTVGGKTLSSEVLYTSPYYVLLLQLVLSPFVEEVLFRGLVLKELLEVATFRIASVVTSLLFVLIHWPYWLYHQGMSTRVLENSVGIFIFSLVACWLYSRTKSVWPPTVAHIANNLLSALIVSQPVP